MISSVLEIVCPSCNEKGVWFVPNKKQKYVERRKFQCRTCDVRAHIKRIVPSGHSDLPHILETNIRKIH